MACLRTPPSPLFDKEGESATPQGALKEVQDSSCRGFRGVPYSFLVSPNHGGLRGLIDTQLGFLKKSVPIEIESTQKIKGGCKW